MGERRTRIHDRVVLRELKNPEPTVADEQRRARRLPAAIAIVTHDAELGEDAENRFRLRVRHETLAAAEVAFITGWRCGANY